MLRVVLTQPFPVAMLQVACTVALEKVLVPRGIALQPLIVGAAHERRVSEKRAQHRAPAQPAEDGVRMFEGEGTAADDVKTLRGSK